MQILLETRTADAFSLRPAGRLQIYNFCYEFPCGLWFAHLPSFPFSSQTEVIEDLSITGVHHWNPVVLLSLWTMSCQEINDLGFAGTFDFFYLPLLGPIKRGVAMLYHISCKLTKKHSFRNTQHIIRRISTPIKSIHWIISWNSIVRVYHVHILPTLIERSGDFLVSLGRREKNPWNTTDPWQHRIHPW